VIVDGDDDDDRLVCGGFSCRVNAAGLEWKWTLPFGFFQFAGSKDREEIGGFIIW